MLEARQDEGFTLVELMVVVLIVGILVAIAIPILNFAQARARRQTCIANLRVLDGAIQQWVAADPEHVAADVDTLAAAQAAIFTDVTSRYVKDWNSSVQCPATAGAAGQYTVTDGTFTCPNKAGLDHTYY